MSEMTYIICARCGSNNMFGNMTPLEMKDGHMPILSLVEVPKGYALIFRCSHCWKEYPLVATPVFKRE